MMTYYYKDEAGQIRHITLSVWEYDEEAKKHPLFTSKKEAKKSRKR